MKRTNITFRGTDRVFHVVDEGTIQIDCGVANVKQKFYILEDESGEQIATTWNSQKNAFNGMIYMSVEKFYQLRDELAIKDMITYLMKSEGKCDLGIPDRA